MKLRNAYSIPAKFRNSAGPMKNKEIKESINTVHSCKYCNNFIEDEDNSLTCLQCELSFIFAESEKNNEREE